MKILIFRFVTIIKCLKHNKLLNYVIIISMMAGLFYPCALLGSFNNNFYRLRIDTALQNQDFILSEMLMMVAEEEDIIPNLKNEITNIEEIGVSATLIRIPALFGNKNDLINLQGLDRLVLSMADRTVRGRIPTEEELEEGASLALVSVEYMQKYSLKLGDTISVYGKELEIIGSIVRGNLVGNVFVPYNFLKEVSINNQIQYQLFTFGSNLDKDNIGSAIEKYYPTADIVNIRNSNELVSGSKTSFIMVMGVTALHSLITLVLSIASTAIIVSGRLINERKNIAIKLAHGSRVKNIISDSIFETFIFSATALIIDLILIYIFRGLLSNIITILFSWHLILYSLILAGFFSLAVGLISGIIAAHFNVSDMLRV